MVEQEDEHAKQDNNDCPNNAEYDVTRSEFSIRAEVADGIPDFLFCIDLGVAYPLLIKIRRHNYPLLVPPRTCACNASGPAIRESVRSAHLRI
jgi:hypothetical protein